MSIIAWLLYVGVNSYGYHGGYGTGIRVLTLNVLATSDDFMSVAFKTAEWEALESAMLPSSLSAEINFRK